MEGDIARDSTRQDTTLAKQVTIVVHCTGARQDMRSDNTVVAKQYSGQAVQTVEHGTGQHHTYRVWQYTRTRDEGTTL